MAPYKKITRASPELGLWGLRASNDTCKNDETLQAWSKLRTHGQVRTQVACPAFHGRAQKPGKHKHRFPRPQHIGNQIPSTLLAPKGKDLNITSQNRKPQDLTLPVASLPHCEGREQRGEQGAQRRPPVTPLLNSPISELMTLAPLSNSPHPLLNSSPLKIQGPVSAVTLHHHQQQHTLPNSANHMHS